jgi:N-formylglutamate amidohydrolase
MWQITYLVNNFVSRHRGTLPVILTCPHDGDEQPPGVSKRTGEGLPSGCDFEDDRDLKTSTITTGVAQRLLDIYGEAPYVVMANFNRDYIDANRTPNCAYEDPNAKPFYDEYHHTIRDFIAEIRAENGGLGLLFDIHGTASIPEAPADLYLGTDDGGTIKRLLQVDPQAMGRRRSLHGFLTAAGYSVLPKPPDLSAPSKLNGGYTVRTYGSSHADGLDAIQLEIDDRLRQDENGSEVREHLIDHLAHAIGSLIPRYADIHTLAALQSINLYGGGTPQVVLGQLQRRDATHDLRLRLGGSLNRGRAEIRHDSGATGEPTAPRRAGILVLYNEDGHDYYLWVDTQGKLRISTMDPDDNSNAGTIVGAQT